MAGDDDPLRKIIVFEKGIPEAAQKNAVLKHGGNVIKSLKVINAQVAQLPEPALKAVLKEAGVIRIDNDVMVSALPKPGNPGGGKNPPEQPPQTLSWGVDRIDADLALAVNQSGEGVKVAVLDTGIDIVHPDLHVAGGINTINQLKSYKDDNGHGTHVAGIIAALNNGIGVVGVAPAAALYSVKVLGRNGTGYLSDTVTGIEWCISNNIQVINMSLGTSSNVQSFQDAVIAANNANISMVAAAGNDYGGPVNYPAAYAEVIAVSATDNSNSLADFSNKGQEVALAAPGVNINSTYMGQKYKELSGTSMASPHVAGTVALIISARGISDPLSIRNILANTADDLDPAGKDDLYGYGLVDAEEAATGGETNR